MTIDKILVELQKLVQFWEGKFFEIKHLNLSQYQTGQVLGEKLVIKDIKLLRLRIMRELHAEEKQKNKR